MLVLERLNFACLKAERMMNTTVLVLWRFLAYLRHKVMPFDRVYQYRGTSGHLRTFNNIDDSASACIWWQENIRHGAALRMDEFMVCVHDDHWSGNLQYPATPGWMSSLRPWSFGVLSSPSPYLWNNWNLRYRWCLWPVWSFLDSGTTNPQDSPMCSYSFQRNLKVLLARVMDGL